MCPHNYHFRHKFPLGILFLKSEGFPKPFHKREIQKEAVSLQQWSSAPAAHTIYHPRRFKNKQTDLDPPHPRPHRDFKIGVG